MFHLYTPWKCPKTKAFTTFSVDIEMEHWLKWVKECHAIHCISDEFNISKFWMLIRRFSSSKALLLSYLDVIIQRIRLVIPLLHFTYSVVCKVTYKNFWHRSKLGKLILKASLENLFKIILIWVNWTCNKIR